MEASDERILQNSCHALSFLATADHARRDEAMTVLQDMLASLRSRLDELTTQKAQIEEHTDQSDDEDEDETLDKVDVSISLVLRRLAVLSKRWPLADLLEDDEQAEEAMVDSLCESVFKLTTRELSIRKSFMDGEVWVVPEIWKVPNKSHKMAADIIVASMTILLSTAGWAIRKNLVESEASTASQKSRNDREGLNPFVTMRERLETILSLCFEQFIDGDGISDEHNLFADTVQEEAGRVSGDLRGLFPRDWRESIDPMLREAALVDDSHLIGGYVRFVHAHEEKVSILRVQLPRLTRVLTNFAPVAS